MVTCACGCQIIKAKSANRLMKRLRESGHTSEGFSIQREDGHAVVDVWHIGIGEHIVSIDGVDKRRITSEEVIPTARLYVDANRLRHRLDKVGVMVIRAV